MMLIIARVYRVKLISNQGPCACKQTPRPPDHIEIAPYKTGFWRVSYVALSKVGLFFSDLTKFKNKTISSFIVNNDTTHHRLLIP